MAQACERHGCGSAELRHAACGPGLSQTELALELERAKQPVHMHISVQ